MNVNRVVISSGHGKYVRGASGYIDEVDEARKVVEAVAEELRLRHIDVVVFHDDVSTTQSENLDRIVDFHNSKTRDVDLSLHFNAFETTASPMGVEVLYVTQETLARDVSAAIAWAGGFIDRGPKYRDNLAFLNGTEMPAILIETCFVDSFADTEQYAKRFEQICESIANTLADGAPPVEIPPDRPERPDRPDTDVMEEIGLASTFGGPNDTGVSPSEGLAFIFDVMDAPQLFLPYQPEGTTGLARRLNPFVHYVACRWDYDRFPKETLLLDVARVRSLRTGVALTAFPADWGPNQNTGRTADLSPSLMDDLGIATDDEVEVIFPWRE